MNEDKKPKILLLDDEKMLLYLYKIKFENSGYEVSVYSSGEDALSALRSGFAPDVILFDITMPDSMSGYEFLEAVQKERLCQKALKIALTNEGQDGEMARTAELGATAHLIKVNFTPLEVVGKVNEMFKSRAS